MKRIFTVLTLLVMLSLSESLYAQDSHRSGEKRQKVAKVDLNKVKEATFQGGTIDDFALWVDSQVDIPRAFSLSSISRIVLVEFMVMEDGSLADVRAVFGSNPEFNNAAVKIVARSPKWEPAEYNGRKVSSRYTVPVIFDNE